MSEDFRGPEDLHELVRQLKAEIAWAQEMGYVEVKRVVAQASPPSRLDTVPPPAWAEEPAPPAAPPAERPTLEVVRAELGDCTRCKLSRLGRKQIVFGVGNPNAELMFVGEGPGADEDRLGEPFVGAAGQLLTKIIEAMGLRREDVYIANVVKCRPPNNRDPEPDEVLNCEPFLKRQIQAVRPKLLVALGKHASHTLLRSTTPITRLRGQWGSYMGTPLMPTYHPAYLLRNPAEKRAVWEDMQAVLRMLGREIPKRKPS